jgi:hypothetical protein
MVWAFKDQQLERDYCQASNENIFARLRPGLLCFLAPAQTLSSLSLFVLRFFHGYQLKQDEMLFAGYRLIVGIVCTLLFLRRWDVKTERKISFGMLYLTRFSYMSICILECGIRQHDTQFMFMLIWKFFFTGIVVSSFSEYLLSSVLLASIKPIRLFLFATTCIRDTEDGCSSEGRWQILERYAILLFVGIVITCLMHVHRRRAWILNRGHLDNCSPQANPAGPSSEQQCPSFILGHVIGSGSLGYVYLATDPATGRRLAVKSVPAALVRACAADADLRAAAALDHPHLVPTLPPAPRGEAVLLAAHYCAGGSVAALLDAVGPLDEPAARGLARQAAAGLLALAERGLSHGDLCCANILLDAAGAARLADAGPILRLKLAARAGAGAGACVAPEVLRGGAGGWPADVWALACCAVEMCAGRTVLGAARGAVSPCDLLALAQVCQHGYI